MAQLNRPEIILKIQELSFACVDLNLYLDNNPEDQDTYEEVTKLIQQDNFRKDFEVVNYINFEQKFIAIICNDKESK